MIMNILFRLGNYNDSKKEEYYLDKAVDVEFIKNFYTKESNFNDSHTAIVLLDAESNYMFSREVQETDNMSDYLKNYFFHNDSKKINFYEYALALEGLLIEGGWATLYVKSLLRNKYNFDFYKYDYMETIARHYGHISYIDKKPYLKYSYNNKSEVTYLGKNMYKISI